MILRKSNFNIKKIFNNIYLYVFLLFMIIQVFFWFKCSNIEAEIEIVPTPPNDKTVKAFCFGDDEFYFRLKLFKVQNMGDTYGRFTALKKYDYKKLFGWFKELEKLNYVSNYLPSLAAYYFSQTQNIEDRYYPVYFLRDHALRNPDKKWWWLYQASSIANYDIKDHELAIELALKLKDVAPDTVPTWVKQTAGLYLAKNGNNCEAIRVISEVMNDLETNNTKTKEEKEEELNYMKYFIKLKMEELKKDSNFNINKCLNMEIKNE